MPVRFIPSKIPEDSLTLLPIFSDNLWRDLERYVDFLSKIFHVIPNKQKPQMSVVGETKILAQLLLAWVGFLCCGYWEMCYQVAVPVTSMS